MLNGFKRSCEVDAFAGIRKVGIIPVKSLTGVAFDTTDLEAIKTITIAASEHFARYEFLEDECEFQENYKVENGVRSVEQKLIFKLDSMSSASRAAACRLARKPKTNHSTTRPI